MKSPTTNSYKLPASAQFFLVQLRCIFVVSHCFFSTSVRYNLATHPGGDPVFSCQLQWTHWHILTSWTPPHINSSITLTLCKIEQNMLLFASFVFFWKQTSPHFYTVWWAQLVSLALSEPHWLEKKGKKRHLKGLELSKMSWETELLLNTLTVFKGLQSKSVKVQHKNLGTCASADKRHSF